MCILCVQFVCTRQRVVRPKDLECHDIDLKPIPITSLKVSLRFHPMTTRPNPTIHVL